MNAEIKKSFDIAVIPGDGIGPEIMQEAQKVLRAVEKRFGYTFIFHELLVGGSAWEAQGVHLPKETVEQSYACDAILFGAVGGPVMQAETPKWKNVERTVILGLRKEFDLFANIRPIKSKDIDFIIVRELTSGIYFGEHRTEELPHREGESPTWRATDIMQYTSTEIERVLHVAFRMAQARQRKLTLIDKANVLDTSRLWRKVAEAVKGTYKDVSLEYQYVDNAAYQMAKNPRQFDVIVTSNLFGDILSDEAAVWARSLGAVPSASFGATSFGLYEPAHGSAPDMTGKNKANPLAMILSAALMLRYSCGTLDAALAIEEAAEAVIREGYGTYDLHLEKEIGMQEFGTRVAKALS